MPGTPSALSAQEFRAAMSMFVTGVTIVTSLDPQGAPIGMTINSFNSVSLHPPLILWSLSQTSHSLPAFKAATGFNIHVLSANQRALAERFASKTAHRFEGITWQEGEHGLPVLEGAAVVFECTHHARHPEGDHVIFVGRVLRCHRHLGWEPLVFHGGRYFTRLD